MRGLLLVLVVAVATACLAPAEPARPAPAPQPPPATETARAATQPPPSSPVATRDGGGSPTAAPASPVARGAGEASAATPQAAAAASAAAPQAAAAIAPSQPAHPNILIITVDTVRADRVGTYGGRALTPSLDRLARGGARFTNAYVQLPQTTPSHAALFTGQYPSTNGVRISQHQQLRTGALTLAAVLSHYGYHTGGLYSWYSLDGPLLRLDQGFDTYRGLVVRKGSTTILPPGEAAAAWRAGEDMHANYEGRADLTTDAALDWLDDAARDRTRPFFLWVHYRDPHYPWEPPPPYDTMYAAPCPGCVDGSLHTLERIGTGWRPTPAELDRIFAAYDGDITYTDQEIGRLLTRLDVLGLAQHTLVVLTADHGEAFGEHGEWFHGTDVHQEMVHVPLIMQLPGVIPAGATVNVAAQLIDVMPTVLELAGLPPVPGVDGRTLWPAMQGRDPGNHVAIVEIADRRYNAVIEGEWKLVRENPTGRRRLYHLPTDPPEQINRADRDRAIADRLEGILDRWLAAREARR